MNNAPADIYAVSSVVGALRQGEILSRIVQLKPQPDFERYTSANPLIDFVRHPYAIIATQDCDLLTDHLSRTRLKQISDLADEKAEEERFKLQFKILPNILFYEVMTAEELRGHADINSSIWGRIKENKDERYHFLQKIEPACDSEQEGFPEMGIDFKRLFSLPTEDVYLQLDLWASRRCRLVSPYLEHFSTRHAYFLSRVGLPMDHVSEKEPAVPAKSRDGGVTPARALPPQKTDIGS